MTFDMISDLSPPASNSSLSRSRPLPSPRSSTSSSSEPSLPPLTPMFDLDGTVVLEDLSIQHRHLQGPQVEVVVEGQGESDDSREEEAEIGFESYSFPRSTSTSTRQETLATETTSTTPFTQTTSPIPISTSSTISTFPDTHDQSSSSTPDLPQAGFSFGTCPSHILQATPTAEYGPFEYPSPTRQSSYRPPFEAPSILPTRGPASGSASGSRLKSTEFPSSNINMARRSSLAESLSYLSMHSNPSIDSIHFRAQAVATGRRLNPSPPVSRRSSTCSTITTLPVGGRRPSVLHSVSIPGPGLESVDPSGTGIPHLDPLSTPTRSSLSSTTTHNPNIPSAAALSTRRPSLLFQQKPLPGPIPPSLLTSRRGSLPASQLFGLPLNLHPLPSDLSFAQLPSTPMARKRSSFSSGMAHGFTTTTPQLYHRRESLVSESGVSSSGSSMTIQGGESGTRRGSSRRPSDLENGHGDIAQSETVNDHVGQPDTPRRGSRSGARQGPVPGPGRDHLPFPGGRRASLPHLSNVPPPGSLLGSRRPSVPRSFHSNMKPSETPQPGTPSPQSPKQSLPFHQSPTIAPSSGLAHHRRSRQFSSSRSGGSAISSTSASSSSSSSTGRHGRNKDGKSISSLSSGSENSLTDEEAEAEAEEIHDDVVPLPSTTRAGLGFVSGSGGTPATTPLSSGSSSSGSFSSASSSGGYSFGSGYTTAHTQTQTQTKASGQRPTFSDPWATSYSTSGSGSNTDPTSGSESSEDRVCVDNGTDGGMGMGERSEKRGDDRFLNEVERRSSVCVGSGGVEHRPALETVDSEETERGDPGT